MENSEIERYKAIASKLSFLAKEKKWSPDEIVEIEIDNETVKVGPFIDTAGYATFMGEDVYVWQENPNKDKLVIYMQSDDWDSWGSHYDDFGNDFSIGEITKYIPVVEARWELDNFPKPKSGPRW